MKKWLDRYQSKGEVLTPAQQVALANSIAKNPMRINTPATAVPIIKQGYTPTPYTEYIREERNKEYARNKAMLNSDLAKTFSSFTPGGDNIDAGVIGAETFANLNPVVSGPVLATSRLAPAIMHPTNNAYWGADRSIGQNALGVLGAAGDVAMVRPALIPAKTIINSPSILRNSLANSMESGLLSNMWRLNPFANKLKKFNRVVGQDAVDDAISSGLIRSGEGAGPTKRPTAWPSFSKGAPKQTYINQVLESGETPYIISTDRPMAVSTSGRHGKGTTMFPIGEDYVHGSGNYLHSFPASEVKIYEGKPPHWLRGLRGYKPIETPSVIEQPFQSEIDWGKWNKEIPENAQLMDEYNAIEQTTKANGSWMKNPDGSEFKGTPEQFVQQNSENFKKAFLDYHGTRLNHNSNNELITFDESFFNTGAGDTGFYGKGIYTHPDKGYTKMYGKNNYELYLNSKNKGFLDKSNIYDAYYFKRSDNEILQHYLPEYENKLMNYKLDPNRYYDNAKENWLNKLNEQVKAGKTSRDKLDKFTSLHIPRNGEVVIPFSNRVKSAIGNNGMFDMTNPNIYKGLIPPAILLGAGAVTQQKQQGGELDRYQSGKEVKYNVPTGDNLQYRVPIGIQQIPVDPFTHQPLTTEQIQMQGFVPYSNKPQPIISQGTWSGNRKTKDVNYDPYSRIIEQDPQSEANIGKRMRKELITKKVPAGVTAAAAIMATPLVTPIIGATMEAPIAGVAGLTGNNIVNAGFATHGLKSVLSGDVAKPWQQANKSGNGWDYTNAAAENLMTAMELFPLIGPGYKGALELGNSLANSMESGLLSRIRGYKPIETPSVGNFDLEELRRIYHNSERFLQPEESKYLHKHGHGLRENYRTDMSNFGWGTDQWNVNNQLPLPPSEIQFMPDGTTRTVYNQQPITDYVSGSYRPDYIDLRRRTRINGHAVGTPEWNRLNDIITQSRTNQYKPKPVNKSGFSKEEALTKASVKDKDVISKMSEEEFSNTVLKPTGEIAPYEFNKTAEGVIDASHKEYTDEFNRYLDDLNDIINNPETGTNTSGIKYYLKGMDESGNIIAYTPKQTLPDGRIIEEGNQNLGFRIRKPGFWRGDIEDIASREYINSIPGLRAYNTSSGVFPEGSGLNGTPGTGLYDGVNKYLKRYDLGRLSDGASGQSKTVIDPITKKVTTGSFDVWEGNIKKNKAVGFYSNPNQVSGIFRTIAPYLGAGYLGYEGLQGTRAATQQKQQGGAIITNRGQWDYPGQTTIIPSNEITMRGVDYPVLGVDNTGHQIMMQPGMNYTFPGQYVTEYPIMQKGGQMSIEDIKNAYKTAAYNYNNRIFPKETLAKRQAAYNTINPTDYTDLRNYGRWLSDEQRDVYSDPRSEEAWKFYLGLNKPEDLRYLRKSKYKPTINATQKNYYSVDPDLEQDLFNAYKDKVELNKTLQTDESELETPLSGDSGVSMLGRFGVSRGQDEKGDYLSYYDKYDLKNFAQKRTKGVPYSIYGRIYYPEKEQGGEMIKRADGSYSRRGLWDNIRANKGSGKAPTKEMLEQERKINNKYQGGGQIPTVQGNFKKQNKYGYWVTDEAALAKEAQRLNSKKVLTENGSLIIFNDNWHIVAVDDNPNASYKQGGVVLNAGGEKHRIYVKSTNRGEGAKGHIMVNHPTMDKGIWDTIDLTEKAGATTIAQGVAATKKWHKENPYKKQSGGEKDVYWRTRKPMVNDPSMDAISKVLLYRNQDKNFMQRAAGFGNQGGIPTKYISGQDPESENYSSLLMAWDDDSKVFPSIIETAPQQLSYLPKQRKEYIETPSWDVADYFSTKGYKRAANDMYGMEYQDGGEEKIKFNPLIINKNIWSEPNYVIGPNPEGHYGYNGTDTINYNPDDVIENINNPWWLGHEKYHHYQTLSNNNPKGKRQKERDNKVNQMIKKSPELQFIPRDILIKGIHQDDHHIPGAEDLMYEDPNTLEGAARLYENYIRAGNNPLFANGGYVVRRSHDRKGKTHVVIGPDGTKKYFGDSKMGQHPNDPARKKAFYARHKHNLEHNPYFRAFARATWKEGGETYAIGGQSTLNPIVKKDNRNWLDYLKN